MAARLLVAGRPQASAKFHQVFRDFQQAEADYLREVGAKQAEAQQRFAETAHMIAAILFQFAARAAGALEGATPPEPAPAPAAAAAPQQQYNATIQRSAAGGLGLVLNTNPQQDAVVTSVSGAAQAAGVRPGSVVLAVQGQAVAGRRAGHQGVIGIIKQVPPTAPIALVLHG